MSWLVWHTLFLKHAVQILNLTLLARISMAQVCHNSVILSTRNDMNIQKNAARELDINIELRWTQRWKGLTERLMIYSHPGNRVVNFNFNV